MSADAAVLWTTSTWPDPKVWACANKDSPPLTLCSKVSFPWYHRTTRFRAGATFVMSHCSWNSLSSNTEVELSTRRMETLSGVSGQDYMGSIHTKKIGDHDSFEMLKNMFTVFDTGSSEQKSNTYCREWSLNVSGTFLFPWTFQNKQASDPSLYRCQPTNMYCQFCRPAESASEVPLPDCWSRWMLACTLHSGPCFDIATPSCLELFQWGIVGWHLWNVKYVTPVQVIQISIMLT